MVVDGDGGWHLSWVWRESWDVATNHDVLYAYSPDQGATWQRSTGEPYRLPITAGNAEVAAAVPQRRGLINQTSMAVADGRPVIVTYWRDAESPVPQYRLVEYTGAGWRTETVGRRTRPFRLEGGGTRRIPVSRPLVLADAGGVHVVLRDEDLGPGIHVMSRAEAASDWTVRTVYGASVGQWEPVHDPVEWDRDGVLHLLVQRVGQGQAETLEEIPPQRLRVLEWRPRS
jgi:hypothetical protein